MKEDTIILAGKPTGAAGKQGEVEIEITPERLKELLKGQVNRFAVLYEFFSWLTLHSINDATPYMRSLMYAVYDFISQKIREFEKEVENK